MSDLRENIKAACPEYKSRSGESACVLVDFHIDKIISICMNEALKILVDTGTLSADGSTYKEIENLKERQ